MNLKELRAISQLLATANPWPLSSKDRQTMIGFMREQDRASDMDLEQLKVLIELTVGSDDEMLDAETWKTLYDLADYQSKALGYDDWTEVYELEAPKTQAAGIAA